MLTYQIRLESLYTKMAYILYKSRQVGRSNLDDEVESYTDLKLVPVMQYGNEMLKEGLIEEDLEYIFSLRKIEYSKNPIYSGDDLKLISICFKYFILIAQGDYMEFSDFSRLILRYENVENKHSSLVQSINSLEDAEEKKVPISYEEYLNQVEERKNSKKLLLSKEDVDRLLYRMNEEK
ncbi:hypothetical protein KGR20_16675 [Cytobacillus oceanisediminis]|uniref:Uncharacterized protein n=2 Tax=Niallia TaxID=2837506 RepID=A0A941JMI4_NIACI|nr:MULTISPECIES: hypothetical protein [Bacillaceae]EOR21572.1 hypothetical protein A499_22637 [Niallia nealsonii AAU1]MBQ6447477.1 hypothetical protein [Bacillus sp. (in: firmicutes)]MDU1847963.1 hypothetical protein [Niallia nealsonii]MBZ9535823.1 hypothetical protein [Cytobacillus oceanisediminis]MCB5238485.1 hypothetical protein [Niallia circulans]